jgi:hypothetical protein
VHPVPVPVLLRKSSSAENRTLTTRPYHLHKVRHILPADRANSVRCECPQQQLLALRDFLYTDEARFTNKRNPCSGPRENPHEIAECHFQQRLSGNVQCGMLDNDPTAPPVTQGRVTAQHYRNSVESGLLLHLEDMALATRKPTSIQHDVGRALTEISGRRL